MNISIYVPELLIQCFLWGCVGCSFLGLLILIGAWITKLLREMRGYWIAIAILTIRNNNSQTWTWGMFNRLMKELRHENPELYKSIRKTFLSDEE